MFLYVVLNLLFAFNHAFLCLLFLSNVTHQHLSLESLDHILGLVHGFVGSENLLSAEFILVLLLFRVELPSSDLNRRNSKVLTHSRYRD